MFNLLNTLEQYGGKKFKIELEKDSCFVVRIFNFVVTENTMGFNLTLTDDQIRCFAQKPNIEPSSSFGNYI